MMIFEEQARDLLNLLQVTREEIDDPIARANALVNVVMTWANNLNVVKCLRCNGVGRVKHAQTPTISTTDALSKYEDSSLTGVRLITSTVLVDTYCEVCAGKGHLEINQEMFNFFDKIEDLRRQIGHIPNATRVLDDISEAFGKHMALVETRLRR